MSLKVSLTPEEVIKVAYLHHVMGIEQHALSVAFSVNSGRIAEACIAMGYTASNVLPIYRRIRRKPKPASIPRAVLLIGPNGQAR